MLSARGIYMCMPVELIKRNISITAKGGVRKPSAVMPMMLNTCVITAIFMSPMNESALMRNMHSMPGSSRGNSIRPRWYVDAL